MEFNGDTFTKNVVVQVEPDPEKMWESLAIAEAERIKSIHSSSQLKTARRILSLAMGTNLGFRDKTEESELKRAFKDNQVQIIRDYLNGEGNIDKDLLMRNISFLVRENGIKMSDLEDLLELSAGYISRTLKPGSEKKLSSEHLWKISRIFDVDLEILLTYDMAYMGTQEGKLLTFLTKLKMDVISDNLQWEIFIPHEEFKICPACSKALEVFENRFSEIVGAFWRKYKPIGKEKSKTTYCVHTAIYRCIAPGQPVDGLLIVPYLNLKDLKTAKVEEYRFDFYRYSPNATEKQIIEIFSTDDYSETLSVCAYKIFKDIEDSQNKKKLSQDALKIIDDYID